MKPNPHNSQRAQALLSSLGLPLDTPTTEDGGVCVNGSWFWVISLDEMDESIRATLADEVKRAHAFDGKLWAIFCY
jgi:hypothetical protein